MHKQSNRDSQEPNFMLAIMEFITTYIFKLRYQQVSTKTLGSQNVFTPRPACQRQLHAFGGVLVHIGNALLSYQCNLSQTFQDMSLVQPPPSGIEPGGGFQTYYLCLFSHV